MAENLAALVYGRVFIGLIFNVLLFGILITQYYIYLTTYKKDPQWMKTFVWVLMVLDIVNSAVNTYFIYDGVITHFGDFEYLALSNWCINADTIITAVIAIMVQLFFAWRIHVLIRNWILTLVVVAISLAGLAMALVTNWAVLQTPAYVDFPQWKGVVVSWLACTGISDIVIAVSLVWYLLISLINRRTHKTGFKKSDVIIDRIIRVTVQTGLLTSIVALLDIITYLSEPDGTHLMLNTPLCKLYANSILSSLNARGGWKFNSGTSSSQGDTTLQAHSSSGLQSFGKSDNNASSLVSTPNIPQRYNTKNPGQSRPEVYVHVESHELQDTTGKRPSLTARDPEAMGDLSSLEDGLDTKYSARGNYQV